MHCEKGKSAQIVNTPSRVTLNFLNVHFVYFSTRKLYQSLKYGTIEAGSAACFPRIAPQFSLMLPRITASVI